MWVDPETPVESSRWESSRGDLWELVMSDEFNLPGRSFRPGDDHMWTSIEKPDGVNDAMEVYAHNKTTTACEEASGVCSFQIEVEDSVTQLQVWNSFQQTPGFENVTFVSASLSLLRLSVCHIADACCSCSCSFIAGEWCSLGTNSVCKAV
ncbi:hypothetical protein PF003_g35847 [Phytophthora fragariae]|nr:hypothetical protein PF003_g35847 [Phytophthora fragariae]